MSNINCSACDELRSEAPTFATSGTTTAVCNSLKNNTGLATNNGHDNETDLADAVDCLIGRMDDELEAYDVCDWKEFMHKYIPNNYEMLKAMLCGDAGQWNNITEMWCWLNHLTTTTQTYRIHAYEDDDPTKPALNGFRIADGVRMRSPGVGNAPITVTCRGSVANVNGSLDFYGDMPLDYTDGVATPWNYLEHGCAALTNAAGIQWGADGCANRSSPFVWEIQFKKCQLGFSALFGRAYLFPGSAGDFIFRVSLYKKGDEVPPDYNTYDYDSQGNYHVDWYTFNPQDDDMLLLQVRLQNTRVPIGAPTPGGNFDVIPCPSSWSC